MGSSVWPFSSRRITWGREIESSKPSRRMFSINTAHLQFAAARDLKGLAAGGVGDADGDVAFGLLQEAITDSRGFAPSCRRGPQAGCR